MRVRLATWDEFDLEEVVWTVPGERMKAKREHRVPLSGRALEVLNEARALSDTSGLVFPSPMGKVLSDSPLSKLLRELDIAAVPHGFRSSFRDWAAECTNAPRAVMEAALALVVGGVEGAYARSDLFERRRKLMDDWAAYLDAERRAKVVRDGAPWIGSAATPRGTWRSPSSTRDWRFRPRNTKPCFARACSRD